MLARSSASRPTESRREIKSRTARALTCTVTAGISYETLGRSLGCYGAGIFDFVPGSRLRLIELNFTKSTKCRVYFLKHRMSNGYEMWCVDGGRSVKHEGNIFFQILGRAQGHGDPKYVKYGPTPDRWAQARSMGANGGYDVTLLAPSDCTIR